MFSCDNERLFEFFVLTNECQILFTNTYLLQLASERELYKMALGLISTGPWLKECF